MFANAARSLLRQPSLTLAAAATLAVGIGAATALFSTVNAALLKPLPYPHAEDIYTVRTFFSSGRFTSGLVASEELAALEQMTDAVVATAATVRNDSLIIIGSEAQQAVSYGVSEEFFELFGVSTALGSSFTPEDHALRAPRAVVLSHALWKGAFGGRPDIVGTSIGIAGLPARIIGVAPAEFDVPRGADLWWNLYVPRDNIGHLLEGYVRLKPQVSVESLEARLTRAMEALAQKYPDQNQGRAFLLRPLLEHTVGDLGGVLLMLFAATVLLLVLASVNVVNLLLARSTARSREMAVRAALGASRRQIIGHLLTEALMLSLVGGTAGAAAAYAAVRLLMRMGGSDLPRMDSLTFDGRVLLFVAGTTVLTSLVVGVLPALRMANTDISPLMNQSGRSVRGSRLTRRMLEFFVVAEVAVAVALVAGAARLVRSFDELNRIDPGFDSRGRLVVDVMLPTVYSNQPRFNGWWQTVASRLRAVGAVHVAAATSLPLQHEWDTTVFADIVSKPDIPPENRPNGRLRRVSGEFFETMGIPFVAGRSFTQQHDGPDSAAVAIVNQAFVRRFLYDRDPLSERLMGFRYRLIDGRPKPEEVAIVGVVADVKYAGLTAAPEPVVYVPNTQFGALRQSLVLTAADGAPQRLIPAVRAALTGIDPNVAIEFGTMSALVASSLDRQRLGMTLMSSFGIAALLLTTIGVFGVIAYVAAQRTAEMAVRQALGATRSRVFWLVMLHGSRTAGVGLAAGLVLAWWTGRLLSGYVYEANPADGLVLGSSAAAVALVAVIATAIPANRAARGEVVRALREAQ